MLENESLSLVLFAKRKKRVQHCLLILMLFKVLKIFMRYDYYSRATQ